MERVTAQNIVIVSVFSLVVGVGILCKANPQIFEARMPGSYEYIRKGERLLDKGRYREAVAAFEEAHAASPDSREITSYLIWAYCKQANALEAERKYDAAIAVLEKAHAIVRNQATIQTLAVMYARRALARSRAADWYHAGEDLIAARSVAADSPNASRNLGIMLFNEAVGEYRAGRETLALLLVKGSLLNDETSHAYDLLGEIYYRRAERERALFYWQKARSLGSERAVLGAKIEKVANEIELARTEVTRSLDHFELRYEGNLSPDDALVHAALEQAYRTVGAALGYFPRGKTKVFIYTEEDFRRIFKCSALVRAFYDGNIRMPFPAHAAGADEITQYLIHEYAHAVISARTDNTCPVWFSEGVAVWAQWQGAVPPEIRPLIASIGEAARSFGALEKGFAGAITGDTRIFYLLAYTVVEYIVAEWGAGSLGVLFERMKGGQHLMNAIDDEFLVSERDLEERWRHYMRQKFDTYQP